MGRELYLICACLLFGRSTAETPSVVRVQVAQGWLEGEQVVSVTGDSYYSFKGIPYAAPPIGNLRFRAPRPPQSWTGIRPAKNHGSECPQEHFHPDNLIPRNEDCLYLNVYTPDINQQKPLTVMVFIHGGAYLSGSGNVDYHGPDFLIRHDVVVVTLNYRLGALGFLSLETPEVPGNAGLKDQVAAFKWVKENIARFGGNPDDVTIFGESAGGASVVYHVLSPMSKGLFKRAISMSGVPSCDWSLEHQPRRRAFQLGKLLGIHTKDSTELLEFLQSVPSERLIAINPRILISEEIHNALHYTPVVEKDFGQEHFMTEDFTQAVKNGRVNDVDLLIGYTNEETIFFIPAFESPLIELYDKYAEIFVPRAIFLESPKDTVLDIGDKVRNFYLGNKVVNNNTIREMVTFHNEHMFVYQIYKSMDMLPKTSKKRFMYQFSAVSGRNVYGQVGAAHGIIGAAHQDDLMYLFDAKAFGLKFEHGSREDALINLTCTTFTNFAKYGTPTPDTSLGIRWPEYDPNVKQYVDIADTLTIANQTGEFLAFWDGIYAQTQGNGSPTHHLGISVIISFLVLLRS